VFHKRSSSTRSVPDVFRFLPFSTARPNLVALRITSTLLSDALPSLLSFLSSSPLLRHLDLSGIPSFSSSSFVHRTLTHFIAESSTKSIRHLQLSYENGDRSPGLETTLISLLLHNRSGIGYLDLRGTSNFTEEDSLSQLVDTIEDSNNTLQMLWLDPRACWTNTPLCYLRDRLNDALAKNRARRKLAHSAALRLVGRFRVMLCLDRGRVGKESGRWDSLPTEILREILRYTSSSGLSRRQVGRIMSWAEERGTLKGLEGGKREVGSKEFLEGVDCWKFEAEG